MRYPVRYQVSDEIIINGCLLKEIHISDKYKFHIKVKNEWQVDIVEDRVKPALELIPYVSVTKRFFSFIIRQKLKRGFTGEDLTKIVDILLDAEKKYDFMIYMDMMLITGRN